MAKRSKNKKTAGISTEVPFAEWRWGTALLLAVFVVYLPVWRAGFLWDDDLVLTANPCIVGPLGLWEIWTTQAADICPLTLTTFWFEHKLWGLAPLPYHLVNVLQHGLAAIVLWWVLKRLVVPGAWLGAALWALHPVQVDSVAWITEMKNTQSGLFFLMATLFFLKWINGAEAKNRNWNYALTLLFAAMAMTSKSSTVVLPVVLCLCAWWQERRWRWRTVVDVSPVFAMALVMGLVSIWTQGFQTLVANDPLPVRTWPERLVQAGDNVWFYLGKLVWPYPLTTIYPAHAVDAGQITAYVPLLAVGVALAVFLIYRTTWARPWFFAFAFFLIALLPVLGLADNFIFHFSLVFDHFQYLASMGPLVLAGAVLSLLAARFSWSVSTYAAILLVPGLLTFHRAVVHQNQEQLWSDTLRHNPNAWIGHSNLGQALMSRGRMDDAIREYKAALQIHPGSPETQYNLGAALKSKGRIDEAMVHYRTALDYYPTFSEALCSLAAAYLEKGQLEEAMAQYQKVVAARPTDAEGHYGIGNVLARKGLMAEAAVEYRKVIALDPGRADAHNNLGATFFQTGQWEAAQAEFREALRLDPSNSDAQTNLAKAQAHVLKK